MVILIVDNQRKSIALSQIEQRLHKKELELHAMTWSLKRHYEFYNDCKLNESISLDKMDSNFLESTQIYYKFALTDCEVCIETELDNIQRASIPISIIIEAYSTRNFRKFIQTHQLDSIHTLHISKPLFENGEEPFYFVINEGKVKDLFFPFKENPNLSIEYIKVMQDKYSI